jgi:hypothetical protein
MGLFSRKDSTDGMRAAEQKAADISRGNAAKAQASGKPVHGIDADGWNKRAKTFQDAADSYS